MYNLRYHIASLVAVFLALALGLILGGLVVQQGTFSKQQRAIVTGLQRDFKSIKDQNASLKSDLTFERGFASQLTDDWITGRLNGRSVVVLTSGAKTEGADAAVSAISAAGGSPVVVTLVDRGFGLDKAKVASAVGSVLPTSSAITTDVVAGLAAEWTTAGSPRPLTDALVKAGAITISGMRPSTAATCALDIAASQGKPDGVAILLMRAYADAGFFAAGAQTSTSSTGVAAAAAAKKLSSFDTLGTNAGRFTLVALFSGGEQGYFGRAAAADRGYPAIPAPQ
jgi:hypothetical protein